MAYSDKTRKILVIILLAGWTLTLAYYSLSPKYRTPKKHSLCPIYKNNRILMGTFFEVISNDKRAGGIVFAEVNRLEGLLSKYKTGSEVSELNRLGRIKASLDTFYIIKRAKEFSRLSQGAFDITIGPLEDLWGFTSRNYTIPSPIQIKEALRLVGWEKIILHEKNNVVEFTLRGMKIDLGGIAKGYALDCAVKKLKAGGIGSCLINAGGQVYCLGNNCGRPWLIAIKDGRNNRIKGTLELTNKSISTSGDYEQYFVKDNQRYCHIINPKTGYPADSKLSSVSVISANATLADALSTAIFVMGKDKISGITKEYPDLQFYLTNKNA